MAGIINDTFTLGDASAYLVWIAARDAHGPGYALVYFNPTDGSVERRERFYAVKAFSEFVGEGWHRVDADCPADPALKLSAYIGPNRGDLVAVLINPTRADASGNGRARWERKQRRGGECIPIERGRERRTLAQPGTAARRPKLSR